MEHKKLSERLLTLPTKPAERTPECPDEHELAASADGKLADQNNNSITSHLANCDFCLAQVALLKRIDRVEPEKQVSEFVLARAKRMGRRKQNPGFRHASRWASAAVIVVAVLVVSRWNSPVVVEPEATGDTKSLSAPEVGGPDQVRSRNLNISKPRVLTPVTGAIMSLDDLVFRWTEVSGSLYYDARVVNSGGDLVWQARVQETELELPEQLQLNPDVEYFFRVDAYLASARRVSSEHVLFSVGEQH